MPPRCFVGPSNNVSSYLIPYTSGLGLFGGIGDQIRENNFAWPSIHLGGSVGKSASMQSGFESYIRKNFSLKISNHELQMVSLNI